MSRQVVCISDLDERMSHKSDLTLMSPVPLRPSLTARSLSPPLASAAGGPGSGGPGPGSRGSGPTGSGPGQRRLQLWLLWWPAQIDGCDVGRRCAGGVDSVDAGGCHVRLDDANEWWLQLWLLRGPAQERRSGAGGRRAWRDQAGPRPPRPLPGGRALSARGVRGGACVAVDRQRGCWYSAGGGSRATLVGGLSAIAGAEGPTRASPPMQESSGFCTLFT